MKIAFSKIELEHIVATLNSYELILEEMEDSFKEEEKDLEPFSERYKQGLDFLKVHKLITERNKRLLIRLEKKMREWGE
jgi:hypothetical protein